MTQINVLDFYTKEGKIASNHQRNVYTKEGSINRMKMVKEALDPLITNRTCLEVGCAEGLYCDYMAQVAKKVVGFDISPDKIERAKRENPKNNLSFLCLDWDKELPFEKDSFDITLLTEVLEHSLRPQELIDKIFNITKIVVATVPINEGPHDKPTSGGHIQSFKENSFKDLFKGRQIVLYKDNRLTAIIVAKK